MARKQRRRIASRGSVNTIILKTLINGDKYGYEIIKDVEKFSDGAIKLKQPSLYSSLSRFEDKGIVSSYWGDSDIGGRRHYYHLTDTGIKYYQKEVLKIKDEIVDEPNSVNTEVVIKSKIIEEKDNSSTPIAVEITDNSIPAIADFTPPQTDTIIPDHNFYVHTPLEAKTTNIELPQNNYKPWKDLANTVKTSNNKIKNSPNKKFHYKKPIKSQVVILDRDGIYKLRDSDYKQHKEVVTKSKIIDNVIKRSNSNHAYGYPYYTEPTPKQTIKNELTEEEKKQRNQDFLAKFNKITENKIAEKSLYIEQKPEPKPAVEEERIDYRSKLDILLLNQQDNTMKEVQDNNLAEEINEEANNIFNYEDDEILEKEIKDDDNFVDFEPTDFETKASNSKYIEEISNYTVDEPVKITRYENKNSYIQKDKSYVLINRVKLIFGIILGILLTTEITIAMLIFKKFNLVFEGDNILFILSYVLTSILMLSYILPFIFNNNARKLNTFKFKYAIALGILTFLITTVLIYCINSLNGFQLDNFNYFAVKLLMPIILAFNFIILPPIYGAIIKNKRFYD